MRTSVGRGIIDEELMPVFVPLVARVGKLVGSQHLSNE